MSKTVGPGRPPRHGRFQKGKSGNPRGRPRKVVSQNPTSVFEVIVNRTLTITQNGEPREVTVEEALQHKTYQDAIAGSRLAQREVLKMIQKREEWYSERRRHGAGSSRRRPISNLCEIDPDNANQALQILKIASLDPRCSHYKDAASRLLLEPWAVQMALSRRRGGHKLTEKEIGEIRRRTHEADKLRFPRGAGE